MPTLGDEDLLGFPGVAAVLGRASLAAAFPGLPAGGLADLVALGVIEQQAPELFLVRAPSLLRLLADLTAGGVPAVDALAITGAITEGIRQTALTVASHARTAIGERSDEEATLQLLRRGRGLIAQGAGRLLIHELGRALSDPGSSTSNARLAGLIGKLRVGGQQQARHSET